MANVDTQIEDYHANLDEKKPKPIYRERESEVEGLKEMEIISPYSRRVEGDWLLKTPTAIGITDHLNFLRKLKKEPKEKPDERYTYRSDKAPPTGGNHLSGDAKLPRRKGGKKRN